MVKARKRSTCTECSQRRQRCDRGVPCGRCVKRGVPDKCQLNWQGGRYDPGLHRTYPSRQRTLMPTPPTPPGETGDQTQSPCSVLHSEFPSLEDEPLWQVTKQNTPRPRYVFKPYEQARLRKSTVEANHGATTSFFTSTSSGLDLGLQSTAGAHQAFLQMLLPSLDHIWQLVDYHECYLLWYHCCYHGPTFRSELESVIAGQDDKTTLIVDGLHLQWLALLFSIMAGALTCSAEWRLREWGFSKPETVKLSTQWYKASITCLNHGNWTEEHEVYSVSAITTLTMIAHPLGRSAELSVLLGTALKIAQALGLDKLSHNAALDEIDEASSHEERHRSIRRELGRKLWSQLCVQDWMSLPSAGSHSINPSHFTTTKPTSRNHLTMDFLTATFPTYISYGNYLFDIAQLVVQHHEAMLQSTTPFTKYQHVLDYDTQMRNLATKGMPRFFHVMEPVDASWPEWVHWARSSLTVCFAHKIIMIHRAYIRRSFTNTVYSKTRVTCLAAAKTILNEAKKARDVNGPIIWIDKAYCVAAAIILCLDIFHRSESDPEYATHRNLVLQCIEQLQDFETGVIAVRGVNLLSKLIAERDRAGFIPGWPLHGIDTSNLFEDCPAKESFSMKYPALFLGLAALPLVFTAPSATEPQPPSKRSAALPVVSASGNAFWAGGERFYVRGIDYQPGGSSANIDPLANATTCKRDVEYFKQLGVNTVRVYSIDNSKSHDDCMSLLEDAGIYLVADVNSGGYSINRNDPKTSYNAAYLQSIFATVDVMSKYNNTMAFFSGNEVINDQPNSTLTAPYVKAVQRDIRNYQNSQGLRHIPVGYSAADVDTNRQQTADYMNCGPDAARGDFFAFNDYSWCDSDFVTSGWDQKVKNFTGYGIPIFLSEYGCIKNRPRTFKEMQALMSDNMTSVYSGGLLFEYSNDVNDMGIVTIKNEEVQTLSEFPLFSSALSNYPAPTGDGGAATTTNSVTCPTSASDWEVDPSLLPKMPTQAQKYMTDGAGDGPGLSGDGSQENADSGTATTMIADSEASPTSTKSATSSGSGGSDDDSGARSVSFDRSALLISGVVFFSTFFGAVLL
ncbi:hypothetical protein G7046_g3981 [Stylonectria norvegica]|nr:hypothetical protein G7046_g3981 [Stylonectria norvegica]